jgi:hypothetical protein
MAAGYYANTLYMPKKGKRPINLLACSLPNRQLRNLESKVDPNLSKQKDIVSRLNFMSKEIVNLETIYKNKLLVLDELKKSILQKAFTGELTKDGSKDAAA